MLIKDCMKRNVFFIHASASIREAVDLIVSKHIGLLPVVDDDNRPIGIVGLSDLLQLSLPSSLKLLPDVDYIGDFGAVENYLPSDDTLAMPVQGIMRTGTVVFEDSGLVRAYALMLQHDLHDLPVVDKDGRLVGIASRVYIGTNIISNWR